MSEKTQKPSPRSKKAWCVPPAMWAPQQSLCCCCCDLLSLLFLADGHGRGHRAAHRALGALHPRRTPGKAHVADFGFGLVSHQEPLNVVAGMRRGQLVDRGQRRHAQLAVDRRGSTSCGQSLLHQFSHPAVLFHGKAVVGWKLDLVDIIVVNGKEGASLLLLRHCGGGFYYGLLDRHFRRQGRRESPRDAASIRSEGCCGAGEGLRREYHGDNEIIQQYEPAPPGRSSALRHHRRHGDVECGGKEIMRKQSSPRPKNESVLERMAMGLLLLWESFLAIFR